MAKEIIRWGLTGVSSLSEKRKNELIDYTSTSFYKAGDQIKSAEWNLMAYNLLYILSNYYNFWVNKSTEVTNKTPTFLGYSDSYSTQSELGNIFSSKVKNHVRVLKNFSFVDVWGNSPVTDFMDDSTYYNPTTDTSLTKSYSIMNRCSLKNIDVSSGQFGSTSTYPTIETMIDGSGTPLPRFFHQDLDVALITEERKTQLSTKGYVPDDLIRAGELNYLYSYISDEFIDLPLWFTINDSVQMVFRDWFKKFEVDWYSKWLNFGVIKNLDLRFGATKRIETIPIESTLVRLHSEDSLYTQYRSLGFSSISALQLVKKGNTLSYNDTIVSTFKKGEVY